MSLPLLYVVLVLSLMATVGLLVAFVRKREQTRAATEEARRLAAELADARATAVRLQQENGNLEALRLATQTELDVLSAERSRADTEREERFNAQVELLKAQLQQASQLFLDERTRSLEAANAKQISAILAPLSQTLGEMKQALGQTRETGVRQNAELRTQIEHVLKTAERVGTTADRLAEALRSDSKVQGNMGELLLTELLESQGLTEGVHFHTQATMRDEAGRTQHHSETGSRLVPDLVLHFPDRKDVIVDSKVSLTAFLQYHEAATEAERALCAERHAQSVRRHVQELARKAYANYRFADHEMLEYVIMFVPNDGALTLALHTDKTLWRDAFAKNVFMADSRTLLAALRIIEMAWRQVKQRENSQRVVELAEEMLTRVGLFCERFAHLSERIDRLRDDYDQAAKTLSQGSRSIVATANKLTALGAKPDARHPLPATTDGGEPDTV